MRVKSLLKPFPAAMSEEASVEGVNSKLGSSDNRADYQKAFVGRIHQLLQLAYESLDTEAYARSEEDDITGDLCKSMKHLTEVEPSERWMGFYSVHDQDPSNDVVSPKTGQVRKGKRRPKIDVRLVCKLSIPNQAFCIEAKRLYRSDSVSQYVDDEGIGAFVCGEYAQNEDCGGMLGYIQAEDLDHWVSRIEAKLDDDPRVLISSDDKKLSRTRFARGPAESFVSLHRRNDGRAIVLYHVMLSFLPR